MEEKNYEHIIRQKKSLGFQEKHKEEIKTAMESGVKEFQQVQEGEFKRPDGKTDKMEFVLHYKKSEKTENYFLNLIDATLLKGPGREEDIQKTYFISGYNKDFPDAKVDITSKEAYNQLSARFVLKDRIKKDKDSGTQTQYPAWAYLDFTQKDDRNQPKSAQYHGDYFDLNPVIEKYPIKGKDNHQVMDDLFYNLEKGNLTQVTFSVDGKEEVKYVAANPIYKNLDVYDANLVKENQRQQHRESRTRNKTEEEVKPALDEAESKKKGQKVSR